MFKKLMILTVFGVTAAVIAQNAMVGAAGRGVARNQEGVGGRFKFEVKKARINNTIRVTGGFEFHAIVPNTNDGWAVHMREPAQYAQEGNVAEFGGPAKLVRRGPNGPITVEGRVMVRVADNHQPGDAVDGETPDRIGIKFIAPNAPNAVEFAGNVTDGDIRLLRRG